MVNVLGIDIGSLFLKAAIMDAEGGVRRTFYAAHQGAPWRAMLEWLDGLELDGRVVAGLSGIPEGMIESVIPRFDGPRCLMEGARSAAGEIDGIIDIGGSSLSLIELNGHGEFESFSANSLCAAGTGSFLDEQSRRLGVRYDDAGAFGFVESPPAIASRCAVFAKSDLIHRQQEGYTKEQMWSGLCRGLASTILQTLFKGRPIAGRLLVAGGVSQNREVMRWLGALAPNAALVPCDGGHTLQARGTALVAYKTNAASLSFDELRRTLRPLLVQLEGAQERVAPAEGERPLELRLSPPCSFEVENSYLDAEGTEVRITRWPAAGGAARCFLGVDIGSTSTKAVLVDEAGEVLADLYRKTLGDPIGAARRLMAGIEEIARARGTGLEVLGCGTTGSGRKMIGMIVGADLIMNEITAHVRGALATDPGIDTIFEIGGQDSKFVRLQGGNVADSNMNYICAAGTGSFVEEQAGRLGFAVAEVGDLVMGVVPPPTSDRCTVFMEQDLNALIRRGYSPVEALAGIMRSVVKNYLNKVVGRRRYSTKKIAFMGATARNKGLVAAFERHLGVPIVVSPCCHVMGAFGVALAARERRAETGAASTFRGLGVLKGTIGIERETCRLCNNHCTITLAAIEGVAARPSWGYLCGRDPEEKRVRRREEFNLFKTREKLLRETGRVASLPDGAPEVAMPMALTAHAYAPLWRRFFGELGWKLATSGRTDEAVKEAALELVNADFCFPVKVLFGHARRLLAREGARFVFIPHMIASRINEHTTDAQFCPWVQGAPVPVRAAVRQHLGGDDRLLTPVVDFRWSERKMVDSLHRQLGGKLGAARAAVAAAWRRALESQREFEESCVEEGRRALAALERDGRRGLVIAGRPYNVNDTGINVDLPEKIAEYGWTVIPIDFLPFAPEKLGERFRNMYWNYGQRILGALRQVAASDRLHAVLFSNFSCGPDSFGLTYAEEIMKDKPMLVLELDEHGADAGYLTRIEAFIDVLEHRRGAGKGAAPEIYSPTGDWRSRRVWIPPMHDVGAELFAAAFRAYGFDAAAMPAETVRTYELGRRLTRGSECMPTAATLGAFVQALRDLGCDPSKEALFMPTAEGPCRFGQYATCHRLALEKAGLGQVAILSPSSYNTYMGLPEGLRRYLWDAITIADLTTKMGCRTRPYETVTGSVDAVLEEQVRAISRAMETKRGVMETFEGAVRAFGAVPVRRTRKPLVGIVGEIYVRSNGFCNGQVIRAIERFGGEAWLSPIGEWIFYTSATARRGVRSGTSANMFGSPVDALKLWVKDRFLHGVEEKYFAAAAPVAGDRREPAIEKVIGAGERYVPVEFEGEAILTVGRAIVFIEDGASMVVSANPFGCMPGTVSAACLAEVQRRTGVPVVSMFYDGEASINDKLASFIENIRDRMVLRRVPAARKEAPLLVETATPQQ